MSRTMYVVRDERYLLSSHERTRLHVQVTHYLQRIAILEQRMNHIEKVLVTRDEVHDAWDSHRKLYSDMFEETLTLRERLWKLGTFVFPAIQIDSIYRT